MIIKDLDGILAGNVTIRQWQDEKESYKILYSSTHFHLMYLSEELKIWKLLLYMPMKKTQIRTLLL